MKSIFYPASERGHVQAGWLDSHHSFSFGHWYHPDKIHFGALRVLNDDLVQPGAGFGMHPHDNMEIVSIPLKGALLHQDSTGNRGVIATGDVQIMSAGTGIMHSEYNASRTEPVSFLQIWVLPGVRNIKPVYSQKTFQAGDRVNRWQTIVSPDEKDGAVWINQKARFALASLDKAMEIPYHTKFTGNAIYFFVVEGAVTIEGQRLIKRDALGISGAGSVMIRAEEESNILAIEVPQLT